jgi:hypothetical protein
MTVWTWLAIGGAALILASAVVGLVIAAILGSLSRNVSQLLDAEPWSSMPLTRARLPRDEPAREPRILSGK